MWLAYHMAVAYTVDRLRLMPIGEHLLRDFLYTGYSGVEGRMLISATVRDDDAQETQQRCRLLKQLRTHLDLLSIPQSGGKCLRYRCRVSVGVSVCFVTAVMMSIASAT